MPEPQASITPAQAEGLAAEWMRYLGVHDARATKTTRDDGVDVTSTGFVAQVKHQSMHIPPAPIRQLHGVAVVEGKQALFFALTGYSAKAVAFADQAGIALMVYSPSLARLIAANQLGHEVLQKGIHAAFSGP